MLNFSIFRFNSSDPLKKSYMQSYELPRSAVEGNMILDALIAIQAKLDPSLAFRRSCGEGVCGSDGMNINGHNSLACIVPLQQFSPGSTIVIKPLPGFPVMRDLIVDLTKFFKEYTQIKPYLHNDEPPPANKERLQSIAARAKLDGLYECVLCACCSSLCPVYVDSTAEFIGPAAMVQAARFILDSRDQNAPERLEQLDRTKNLFKCRNVLTCIDACPKGLDPNKAINDIEIKASES